MTEEKSDGFFSLTYLENEGVPLPSTIVINGKHYAGYHNGEDPRKVLYLLVNARRLLDEREALEKLALLRDRRRFDEQIEAVHRFMDANGYPGIR